MFSRRPAFVAVVEAADLRDRHDRPYLRRLDRVWFWGVLLQGEVRSRSVIEVVAEDPIPIAQQVAWRGIPRKGLREWLRGPVRRGASRDAEVEDPAALVGQHQEYVQDLEADGRNGEEIDGYQALDMILEEGAPGLPGWPPVPYHAVAHAGLADVETELEQFTVDPRCARGRILPAHLADQIPDFA
jgi:hypothetical protein